MAQWAKSLLYKYGDLSCDSQHPLKYYRWYQMPINPVREPRDKQIPGLTGQLIQLKYQLLGSVRNSVSATYKK